MKAYWAERVINRACEIHGFTREEFMSPSRARKFAHARFAVAFVLRDLGMPSGTVSRRLGRTDHSTALYAAEQAEILCRYVPGYPEIIAELFDAAAPGLSASVRIPHLSEEAA